MTSLMHDTGRALVARSVSKRFGPVRALEDVDILVAPGRVHALVGENGAGKSTLAKILAGVERADSGSLSIEGAAFAPRDRADARAAGVNMVPQHLSLVGELTLVENLLLTGSERIVRRGRARTLLLDTMEHAGVRVDPDRPVGGLSQAHRQLGEIVVALAEGARTLILDEPTASLGPVEVGGLFDHVRRLAEFGTGILLITHRLDEVRDVADDVTVLSHGRDVHHGSATGLEPARIAELMVGELPAPPARVVVPAGGVVLDARGLSAATGHGSALDDITLRVHEGEVLGVAGVAGSGQNLLLDVLAGLVAPDRGRVIVDGVDVTGSAVGALGARVAWIPEERSEAIVPSMTAGANLGIYAAATTRRTPTRGADPTAILRAFDVRPPRPELVATGLSGGNQQKLLVARELAGAWPDGAPPRLVLAYGPTQGLDLRAAGAIRARLRALAADGAAVLVASHDLEELLDVADRVAVLFAGRLVADLPISEATTERLGAAMSGLQPTASTPGDPA